MLTGIGAQAQIAWSALAAGTDEDWFPIHVFYDCARAVTGLKAFDAEKLLGPIARQVLVERLAVPGRLRRVGPKKLQFVSLDGGVEEQARELEGFLADHPAPLDSYANYAIWFDLTSEGMDRCVAYWDSHPELI